MFVCVYVCVRVCVCVYKYDFYADIAMYVHKFSCVWSPFDAYSDQYSVVKW